MSEECVVLVGRTLSAIFEAGDVLCGPRSETMLVLPVTHEGRGGIEGWGGLAIGDGGTQV